MSADTAARVVVIGGTGFVGASICAQFRDRGYDVLAIGRHAVEPDPGWRTRAFDVLAAGPQALAQLLAAEAPTVVVNAAGAVWSCTEEQMYERNVLLVEHLLAALESLPHRPRLIQLGSVHEYGVQPAGVRLSESIPAAPNTPYGRTKLQGTEAVLAAAAADRVPGVVLRMTNVIGAGAPAVSLPGRVAGELAMAERAGQPAVLTLSPLQAQRDFVDSLDAADAAVRAAEAAVVGELINVGGGRPVAVRSVVDRLIEISGVPTTVLENGEQEQTRSVYLDWQEADVRRAGELLDWRPQRSLDDSLRSLWESVRPQP